MAARLFKALNLKNFKKVAEGVRNIAGTTMDFTGVTLNDISSYIGRSGDKKVNLADFSKELKAFAGATIEDQRTAVSNGIVRAFPELVANSPVDTGEYAASWDMTQTETSVILGNYAPHAPIIEYGARPFKPPLGPLLAWAKRVLQDPSKPPNYSKEVWGLAIGVQKKIEANGMKPKHVLENMIPTIIQYVVEELKRGR